MAGKGLDETQSSAGVERASAAGEPAGALRGKPAPKGPREVGHDLEPGTVIAGRFVLEACLGEGGMGVVWRATHAVTRKAIALKFLKRQGQGDTLAVKRFLREARAACAVQHPSIVEIHDILELGDGSPVMVMELLEGETLAQRLDREEGRKLQVAEFARIMVHVCSAVACAHAVGIVHRDLKPENIFLADVHGARVVKVLDFGIAKLTARDGNAMQTDDSALTGGVLGTPYYMAPEQLLGDKTTDHRADIWTLGIIFYEMLAGAIPTEAPNVGQVIRRIITGGLIPLRTSSPSLPEPVLALVDQMLSIDAAKRPADLGAVLAVLSTFTEEPFVSPDAPQARFSAPEDSLSRVVIRPPGASARGRSMSGDTAEAPTQSPVRPVTDSVSSAPLTPVPKTRVWPVAAGGVGIAAVLIGAWTLLGRDAQPRERRESATVMAVAPSAIPSAATSAAPAASAASSPAASASLPSSVAAATSRGIPPPPSGPSAAVRPAPPAVRRTSPPRPASPALSASVRRPDPASYL